MKFDAGAASAADTAKADAQAATTAADIPTYEAGYAELAHRLSVLTGRAPGALDDRMQTPRAIPAPRKPLPAGVPADLLTRRPDVRAAERRVAQATAKIGAAEAALYPDVSLTGSLSTTASRPGELLRASSVSWSWGPSVSMPIFDGGKLAAERDATQAQRDEYLVAWRSSVLTAMEDVENALVSLSQERLRAKQLGAAVDNDRKAADLTRTQYEAGKSSLLDVLDAERSLYSAEDSLIQSRVSLAKDYVALAKALGGGWDAPVDASRRGRATRPWAHARCLSPFSLRGAVKLSRDACGLCASAARPSTTPTPDADAGRLVGIWRVRVLARSWRRTPRYCVSSLVRPILSLLRAVAPAVGHHPAGIAGERAQQRRIRAASA